MYLRNRRKLRTYLSTIITDMRLVTCINIKYSCSQIIIAFAKIALCDIINYFVQIIPGNF